jgi:hypothetical protein
MNTQAPAGAVFRACTLKQDAEGNAIDIFEDSEQAAQAYDETARKLDEGRATLNFSCPYDNVGKHVKDNVFSLVADDGVPVTGVQTGVDSCVRLCLKYFDYCCHYLEIHLDKCTNLPKMDSGFGLCDAYCHVLVGHYHFRTRVVKNSLDPNFLQTFRITVPVWNTRFFLYMLSFFYANATSSPPLRPQRPHLSAGYHVIPSHLSA